jgi:hypothetical protein
VFIFEDPRPVLAPAPRGKNKAASVPASFFEIFKFLKAKKNKILKRL